MLRQAAAVFICLAAMLTLELSRGSLVLLAQTRTVASSSHLGFRLFAVLEGGKGRPVYHSHLLWYGSVLGQAARLGCIVHRCKGGFRHGAAAIDHGAFDHGIVQGSPIDGRPRERRALAPVDAVGGVYGVQRRGVRVRAAIRIACGQAVRRRAHGKAILSRGTRHGDFLGTQPALVVFADKTRPCHPAVVTAAREGREANLCSSHNRGGSSRGAVVEDVFGLMYRQDEQ